MNFYQEEADEQRALSRVTVRKLGSKDPRLLVGWQKKDLATAHLIVDFAERFRKFRNKLTKQRR